jgi:hypothetical protein
MKIQEYKWIFFQDEEDRLPPNHKEKWFVRSYFNKGLNIKISESIYGDKLKAVYYYNVTDIKTIRAYHKENYTINKVGLLLNKGNNVFFLKIYQSFEFLSLNITRFDKDKREKDSLLFNQNYRLTQYNESIYENDKDELPIKEKLFYPSVWKIHEEDMD